MGIAKLLTKKAKVVKQGLTNPTTNKPLYAAAAIAVGQKVMREKLKSKKEYK